jgi:hypothetical protein
LQREGAKGVTMSLLGRLLAAGPLLHLIVTPSVAQESRNGEFATTESQCDVVGILVDQEPASDPRVGGFTINATFNANVTAAQQNVCQQAINEWQAIVVGAGAISNPYPITFQNGALAGNILAQAATSWNASGTLVGTTITIDNDGSSVWFVDLTPGADEEFDADGVCDTPTCQGASDLLSVTRHEIGHTGAFGQTTNPLIVALVTGTTFDQVRLNIAMDPAPSTHTDPITFANELMNPAIPAGRRREITLYPSGSLPARGINHDVSMRYVDASNGGTQDGSADNPWSSLVAAVNNEVRGTPLLMIPGSYGESPVTIGDQADEVHTISVANGGSAVVD